MYTIFLYISTYIENVAVSTFIKSLLVFKLTKSATQLLCFSLLGVSLLCVYGSLCICINILRWNIQLVVVADAQFILFRLFRNAAFFLKKKVETRVGTENKMQSAVLWNVSRSM